MRTILVNMHDKACRDWLEKNKKKRDVVLDWYNVVDQLAWIEAGGTDKISSFPIILEKEK